MVSIKDIDTDKLIKEVAKALKTKEELTPPDWAQFAKTGVHKEKPPMEKDWWYTRAASVLRTIHLNAPVGVSKLRSKYGGKKNRGVKTEKFRKGSGSVIRKILQQLEKAELIKQKKTGVHKGRILTPQGESLLSKAAAKLAKNG